MKYSENGQCPECGSIRFNIAFVDDQESQYEEHRFCRTCDCEYVYRMEKQSSVGDEG